jgi:hypothetical protein
VTDTKTEIAGGGLARLEVASGRIFTTDEAGSQCDDGFDLGPPWYSPHMQPAIGELVTELNLAIIYDGSFVTAAVRPIRAGLRTTRDANACLRISCSPTVSVKWVAAVSI